MIRRIKSPGERSIVSGSGSSRSGGMLILVLVLMAVGVILITSALAVTAATRNHFFVDAQQSQARLTVTSAAKTIVDAILVSQELNDDRVEQLAASGGSLWIRSAGSYEYSSGLGSPNTVAPGVANADESSNSYTKATFSSVGSDGDVNILFTTYINVSGEPGSGTTDSLLVALKKKPADTDTGDWPAVLNLGSSDSYNTLKNMYVGWGEDGGSPTNISFVRGNYSAGTGGNNFSSTVIYTGILGIGDGVNYMKDVVFLGDEAGLDVDRLTSGTGVQNEGYLLFIGKNGGSVFWKKSGTDYFPTTLDAASIGGSYTSKEKANIYFNTTFRTARKYDAFVQQADTFVVSGDLVNSEYNHPGLGTTLTTKVHNLGSGNIVKSDSLTLPDNPSDSRATEITNKLNEYNKQSLFDAASSDIMSMQAAVDKFAAVYPTGTLTSLDSKRGSVTTITKGDYKVSGGTLTANWTVDCAGGPVKIVIEGDMTFLKAIYVKNVSKDVPCYIFLKSGVDLTIGTTWNPTASGIVWGTPTFWGSSDNQSLYPTGNPYVYIIGYNENIISLSGSGACLYGYCGLYGTGGTITFSNNVNMYGRFEVTYFSNPAQDGQPRMPFCPAPWEESQSGDKLLVTEYELDYYEYL